MDRATQLGPQLQTSGKSLPQASSLGSGDLLLEGVSAHSRAAADQGELERKFFKGEKRDWLFIFVVC